MWLVTTKITENCRSLWGAQGQKFWRVIHINVHRLVTLDYESMCTKVPFGHTNEIRNPNPNPFAQKCRRVSRWWRIIPWIIRDCNSFNIMRCWQTECSSRQILNFHSHTKKNVVNQCIKHALSIIPPSRLKIWKWPWKEVLIHRIFIQEC